MSSVNIQLFFQKNLICQTVNANSEVYRTYDGGRLAPWPQPVSVTNPATLGNSEPKVATKLTLCIQ